MSATRIGQAYQTSSGGGGGGVSSVNTRTGAVTLTSADIPGSALTSNNDTNVTLTLGGSPSNALLNATSLTLGWTGQLGLARGGTNTDLSATGGTSNVLKQSSVGATITVGQLAASDLSNGTTGSGAVVLAGSPGLTGNPTAPTQIVSDNSTKIASTAFVTTAVNNAIAGVNPAIAVQYATVAAGDTSGLTYNNGASGIGATFTGVNNATTTIDGHTFVVGDVGITRILVKNDTQSPSGAFNGVYLFTALHTSITGDIFTRALDYDMPSDINNTGAIPVILGTVNATTSWVETAQIVTVGTTPLSFTQFSLSPAGLDARYVRKSGDTMTGNLNITSANPSSNYINTSGNQFDSAGFFLYSNTVSLGNNGGVHLAVNIADAGITNSTFAIDQVDHTGVFVSSLMHFDFSAATFFVDTLSEFENNMIINGTLTVNGSLTLSAQNIITDTTTGLKIGTSVSQKLGFYNATPVIQSSGATQAAAPAGGTGATAGAYDTAAHRDALINLVNSMRTTLVNLGLMKGSA